MQTISFARTPFRFQFLSINKSWDELVVNDNILRLPWEILMKFWQLTKVGTNWIKGWDELVGTNWNWNELTGYSDNVT